MATYCEKKLQPKEAFDPRSFRWKKSGKARVLVGCPKGEWSKRGHCKVGMRAHVLLIRAHGSCHRGQKRISKG